jgi:dTDP-4-dehydrorhamnose 3,5-epimerase
VSFEFNVKKSTQIDGIYIIKPSVSDDLRGDIWTSFLHDEMEKLLPIGLSFKHDKFSESRHNVLRGIHGDTATWKLVTCVFGEVHQVVADLRPDSQTFMKWEKFIINKNRKCMILIPPGVGNAYYVSSQNAVYHYKLAYNGGYIDAANQFTYRWNDPNLGIDWPSKTPILSPRDSFLCV